jgi:hypothetical protein
MEEFEAAFKEVRSQGSKASEVMEVARAEFHGSHTPPAPLKNRGFVNPWLAARLLLRFRGAQPV